MAEADAALETYLREQQAFHASTFNKYTFTLAAGSLAISVSFISGADKEYLHLTALGWGWGLLILSLVAVLVSHYLSAISFTWAYANTEDRTQKAGYWIVGKFAKWTALSAALVLVAGLVSLVVFATRNL